MPSSSAFFWAPSFIFTKKGLESVLVIRQAPISAAVAAPAKPALRMSAPNTDRRGADVMRVFFIVDILPRVTAAFLERGPFFRKPETIPDGPPAPASTEPSTG